MRREARQRIADVPAVRRQKFRRRILRTSAAVLALLLLLLVRCDCAEPPPEIAAAPPPGKPAEFAAPTSPPPATPAPRDRIATQRRGKYASQARGAPSWLEEFHLQVSARSPRLAQCFTGADRPGALRWAASLNAKSGAVSDHELEPLGTAADLTLVQRECVVKALSNPTYRLNVPEAQPLPNRVSLVIEF